MAYGQNAPSCDPLMPRGRQNGVSFKCSKGLRNKQAHSPEFRSHASLKHIYICSDMQAEMIKIKIKLKYYH